MYWPSGSVRRLRDEYLNAGGTILDFQCCRRTGLFVLLGRDSLTLWSQEVSCLGYASIVTDAAQPTCRIARLDRSRESQEQFGDNQLVEWSSDGHSIFVSVSIAITLKPCVNYDEDNHEPHPDIRSR